MSKSLPPAYNKILAAIAEGVQIERLDKMEWHPVDPVTVLAAIAKNMHPDEMRELPLRVQPSAKPVPMMPIMRTDKSIPFTVLNEEWAQRNHYQSLKRLAERGGLSAAEALAVIEKRRFIQMDPNAALAEVERYVRGEPVAPDTGGPGARAYACFAENGNCIIWSTKEQTVAEAAAKHGRPYIPLYGPGAGQVATVAAGDVLVERARQIIEEGWTPEHDDEHVNDEIAAMACFYAMPPGARDWPAIDYGDTWGEAIRPENWNFQTGDRRRELVKAAALALAEIERMDRAAAAEQKALTC